MSTKNIFSLAASIIKLFIVFFLFSDSKAEENKADEGDKATSDASEKQTPAENLEKAETETEAQDVVEDKEDNKDETAEEKTEEVSSDEGKDEENLADELKELSDTMSSEVDNDKK